METYFSLDKRARERKREGEDDLNVNFRTYGEDYDWKVSSHSVDRWGIALGN